MNIFFTLFLREFDNLKALASSLRWAGVLLCQVASLVSFDGAFLVCKGKVFLIVNNGVFLVLHMKIC